MVILVLFDRNRMGHNALLRRHQNHTKETPLDCEALSDALRLSQFGIATTIIE
jgi:hypothetical protein